MDKKKKLKVKCPTCKTQAPWEGNLHRPFCSERCAKQDLAKWADEGYTIAGSDFASEDDDSHFNP